VHPPPLATRGDDSRAAKIRQMARDFRLADPQNLHKIADADFLVRDEVEEAQPRAIGQGAKEKIDWEWFLLPGHVRNYIWLDRYGQAGVRCIHMYKRIYS